MKSQSAGSGSKSPTAATLNSRKDPNEEFFMMTLLAYKLNHNKYEKILTVSVKDQMVCRSMGRSFIRRLAKKKYRFINGLSGLKQNSLAM